MKRFRLRELDFELPARMVQGGLAIALNTGRYEKDEADAMLAHLRPEDRLLDMGAGMGFICALAAQKLGAARVFGVEAGPETLELARANLARNGFAGVALRHGAVVGQAAPGDTVDFVLREAFWASGLHGGLHGGQPAARVVQVPALSAAELLAEIAPSVLSCDIEGAELQVLTGPMPASLRLIITEIHPSIFGAGGTKQIFDALSAQGFVYEPKGSRGTTVVFARL